LHLAGNLLCLAFGLELAVADYFASNLLHFSLDLIDAALDAIFIHSVLTVLNVAIEG